MDIRWGDIELIHAVTTAGSLSGAARRLRVNQTTASRRLAQVEKRLGLTLFDRIDGRMLPTPAVFALKGCMTTIEDAADTLRDGLLSGRTTLTGRVTISSLGFHFTQALAPALNRLAAVHPDISVELIAEDRNASFERREADIAIRFAGPEDPVALMTRLGAVTFRRYRSSHSAPGDPAPTVRYGDSLSHLPEMRLLDVLRPGVQPMVRANRLDILKEAAASLRADVMLAEEDGDRDHRFRRADPDEVSAERPLFLLVHPDRRQAPSVSAVVDWLKSIHSGLRSGDYAGIARSASCAM